MQSRTLVVWSRQSLPRSPVQLKATLLEAHVKTQDHCDTDLNSNQALAASLAGKKDEANVPVSTCSMPASSSSTRRPGGPGARMDQNMYVSMTTRSSIDEKKKPSFARSAPLWDWQQTKIALGEENLPCHVVGSWSTSSGSVTFYRNDFSTLGRCTISSHDKGIGNFNEQWTKTSHYFQTVRSRQLSRLSRVVITRAYLATRKNTKKKTTKRREKKRKMNGVEINTRAYVATRLLLRWDYLYAVTLKTKVFGDYNHARLEVSWITSTRGLLLRGYTGVSDETRTWCAAAPAARKKWQPPWLGFGWS